MKQPVNPLPKKQRIQLDLSPSQQVELTRIRDEHDMQSYSEVFRRAMFVYGKLLDKQKEGKMFGLLDDNSNFTEIMFL